MTICSWWWWSFYEAWSCPEKPFKHPKVKAKVNKWTNRRWWLRHNSCSKKNFNSWICNYIFNVQGSRANWFNWVEIKCCHKWRLRNSQVFKIKNRRREDLDFWLLRNKYLDRRRDSISKLIKKTNKRTDLW